MMVIVGVGLERTLVDLVDCCLFERTSYEVGTIIISQ